MIRFSKTANRIALCIALLSLCAGCANGRKIESNKAEGYNKVPRYILVFLPSMPAIVMSPAIPNENESYVADGFTEVFMKFASDCKIEAHSNLESRKDGKMPPADQLISVINPEWVMTVEPTRAQTVQTTVYGSPVGLPSVTGMTYNVTITDHVENKKVWRANVTVPLSRSWLAGEDKKQPGRNTANMIIKQMQTDGLLTTCPASAL